MSGFEADESGLDVDLDAVEDLRVELEGVHARLRLAVDRGRHVTPHRREQWALAAQLTADAARALADGDDDAGDRTTVVELRPGRGRLDGLSFQQRRVLDLMAEGMTNAEIAAELHLSPNTVRNYLSAVFQVLGVSRRAAAAAHAARLRQRD